MGKHSPIMADAKSSQKGQVTIPAEIRERLGLKPGGTVMFIVDDEGRVRVVARTRDISHLFGIFGPQPKTIDIDEAIMEAVWERTRPDRTEFDV